MHWADSKFCHNAYFQEAEDLKVKLEKCEAEIESLRKENESSLLPLSSFSTEKYVTFFISAVFIYELAWCTFLMLAMSLLFMLIEVIHLKGHMSKHAFTCHCIL